MSMAPAPHPRPVGPVLKVWYDDALPKAPMHGPRMDATHPMRRGGCILFLAKGKVGGSGRVAPLLPACTQISTHNPTWHAAAILAR